MLELIILKSPNHLNQISAKPQKLLRFAQKFCDQNHLDTGETLNSPVQNLSDVDGIRRSACDTAAWHAVMIV